LDAHTFAYSSIPLAFFLWFVSFRWRPANFWVDMSFATALLLTLSLYFGRRTIPRNLSSKSIILGVSSALALYLIFFLGQYATLMLPSGRVELNEIYSIKLTGQPLLQGIVLVFPIAVGEEVYWRGLLQNQLSQSFGGLKGLILSSALYGMVHLWSRSVTLVVAALVAGLWWGLIFNRTRNVFTIILSHSLWSLLVFVILPL